MDAELRRAPRKRLQHFLPVLDATSHESLGRLVDISASGMMLIGSKPLPVDQELRLEIQAPADSGLGRQALTALTVWSRNSTNNQSHYGSGLQFLRLSPDDQAWIETLIRNQES